MINILREIGQAKSVAIGGHIRPDGDCVGSCMAMYNFLRHALDGVRVDVYLEQPAEIFNCVAGVDEIKRPDGTKKNFDAFIALDCNAERLGDARPIFDNAKIRINIDHHISNQGEGNVNHIVPDSSSACELVYDCIMQCIEDGDVPKDIIDEDTAKALYVGIIHDTGIMQYSNTSPKTLRIVADLLEHGFDFPTIIDRTFYEKTYVQNQIMGRALLESILVMDKKVIVSHLDHATMKFYGVTSKDMDGIVNQLRYTKGVDCAIFMYEIAPLSYKVSMRSNGVVDCSKVCTYFGGGGHVRAAGCMHEGTFFDAVNNLTAEIEKQYRQ
ncbi:MAG: bifunctional oligoribonuclease/PAP phosphatase NrnA [Lachnospiraceae bacterium]|nr:bifunctional oligoribonuclease/PAP phosphatase NrnA [Lachnospiraceae bacterium]